VVSVPLSVDDPEHTHHVNLTATVQLLRQARASGVKRFLLASSSAIYGDSEVLPKHERMPPLPRSPYALQKYASEQYAQLFHALYGLETVSFRYFNVFGPRQSAQSPYSGVIARFCTALLGDQTPRIFGDGQQTRDFVFVSDVVAANLLAATAPAAEVAGRVFNVASGQSVTLLKLLEELAHLTGRRVQPCFEPARAGDVRHSAADLSALREAVGFAPGVTLREGLRATLAFYREADGRMGNDAI
jgi:UDP-glucose 4-epimerase